MKKRLLSILLTLAMVLTLMPGVAWATGEEPHEHSYINGLCACGEHNGEHTNWTAWGDDTGEKTSLPNTPGNYYLTTDVGIESTWNVTTSGITNLCLNGHVIRMTGSGSVINVPSGATLNLYDCGTTAHYFDYVKDGAWTLNTTAGDDAKAAAIGVSAITEETATGTLVKILGGVITGGNTTGEGAGILVNSGTLTMFGGTIVGNRAGESGSGGGMFVYGRFTLNGGAICGNACTGQGGGVYQPYGGTFEMNGGSISYNTATAEGGGVYLDSDSTLFTLNDGEISNNKALQGGGVYFNNGNFTMNGGKIADNTISGDSGAGVYVYNDGIFTMTAGEISGNIIPYDNDNHFEADATNFGGGGVYNGGTFEMSGGKIARNSAIKVKGTLGGGVYNAGTFTMTAGEISGNKATYGGGGVYAAFDSITKISGGKITANECYNYVHRGVGTDGKSSGGSSYTVQYGDMGGGGVFYEGKTRNGNTGAFILGGTAQIYKNYYENETDPTDRAEENLNIHGSEGGRDASIELGTGTGDGGNGVPRPEEGFNVGISTYYYCNFEEWTKKFCTNAVAGDEGFFFCDNKDYTIWFNAEDSSLELLHEHDEIEFKSWDNSTTLPGSDKLTGGVANYSLAADVTLNETWEVPAGTVNLCLNGCVIRLTDGAIGSVIKIGEGATLNIYDCCTTKKHDGYIDAAGLWHLGAKATLEANEISKTITGGIITGGTGKINVNYGTDGGGVYVSGGVFTMSGGNIAGNCATKNTNNGFGGGVYVIGGTFRMSGGIITGNTAGNSGGGVCVENSSTFTMSDGSTISENKSDGAAGVYCKNSVFTMSENSQITKNIASKYGGGVTLDGGNFTMSENSIIADNESSNAGGVYVNKSSLTIEDGTISGNTAKNSNSYGGGVLMNGNDSSLTMYNGSIVNNSADYGGGICVAGNITIGGIAKITNNKNSGGAASNLYLLDNKTIAISSESKPVAGMLVGVTLKSNEGPFTTDTATLADANYFEADDTSKSVIFENGVLKLVETASNHIHNGINFIATATLPNTAGNYYLSDDITIESTWDVPVSTGAVNLCLNGHVIKMTGRDSVIKVGNGATLNLYDCDTTTKHYFTQSSGSWMLAADQTTPTEYIITGGCITGGHADNGGGINIKDGGSFTMNGGNIVGNVSQGVAGGVYNASGVFTMNGGLITANKADECGGGVASWGETHLSGKIIIKDNSCYGDGPENLAINKPAFIDGALTGSEIYITLADNTQYTHDTGVLTSGYKANNAGAGLDTFFHYDGPSEKKMGLSVNGELVVLPTNAYLINVSACVNGEITAPLFAEAQTLVAITVTPATGYQLKANSLKVTKIGGSENVPIDAATMQFIMPGFDVSITAEFERIPTPSTGGSSSSTITVPVTGDENTVKVSASVSGSTATVKKIADADLEKVTAGESVSIDLSGVGKNVDTAKIPTQTVEKIAEKSAMTVKLPVATVEFDKAATEEITDQAEGKDIELVVDDIKEVSLNAVQKEAVGKLDTAIIIDAHLASNGKKICTEDNGGFGGGSAKVILPYEIKNNRKPENYSVFYVNDEGKLQKLNAVYDEELKAFVFEIEHFSVYAVAFEQFVDIDVNAYYYDAVKWAAANGVTNGVDETHFNPRGIVDRAQMVTFLWKIAGRPEPTITECPFTDVKADSYYHKAVLWAYEKGITDGTSATTFEPGKNVSRAQTVTFLWRYAGKPVVDYYMNMTDVADDRYYTEAVRWALSEKITEGTTTTTFSPNDDCLRGQIVTFLFRDFAK